MPDGGQIAAAFLIGRKAVQDGAEDQGGQLVADAEKSGLFRRLTSCFRKAPTLPPYRPVNALVADSAGQDIGTQFNDAWEQHWNNVAAALKEPIDGEPS